MHRYILQYDFVFRQTVLEKKNSPKRISAAIGANTIEKIISMHPVGKLDKEPFKHVVAIRLPEKDYYTKLLWKLERECVF